LLIAVGYAKRRYYHLRACHPNLCHNTRYANDTKKKYKWSFSAS
jgi:hypothetical protein